jgi:glycosidase
LRPFAFAGTNYEYPSSVVAKRCHLSDLPKEFSGHHRMRYRDLRGVTQRLDYLKNLGIDAIWLTPFYISPQIDNGYDVANYTAIDPAYGTLDDFDDLVAQAHSAASALCWIWCLTTPRPSTRGSANH